MLLRLNKDNGSFLLVLNVSGTGTRRRTELKFNTRLQKIKLLGLDVQGWWGAVQKKPSETFEDLQHELPVSFILMLNLLRVLL